MAKKTFGNIFIGTSNVVIPGNKSVFPTAFRSKSRLHYYGSLFNSVELNSPFYKVPQPSTFSKWSGEVPAHFKFSIKLWRDITHVKDLAFKEADIAFFLAASKGAGEKRGPLLIQFPGKINLDYYNKVERILECIRTQDEQLKVAVEFRNPAWYAGETLELLDEFGASLVLHDIPKSRNIQINRKAPFVYIRFHGLAGDYRGSYPDEVLISFADKINSWKKEGLDVFAYFNNTIGAAYENAHTLKKLTDA